MSFSRTSVQDFALANALYAGATVTAYAVDSGGHTTATLATLWDSITAGTALANPQTLDSQGKFAAPVYVDSPVVFVVTGLSTVPSHSTGIVAAQLTADAAAAASASAAAAVGYMTIAQAAANRLKGLLSKLLIYFPSTLLVGDALKMLRVKSDGSGYELRTPAQVRSDIAAVNVAGDTMTGLLTINPASGAGLAITGPVGNSRFQQYQTSGTARWSLGLAIGESGVGNAGSDYFVQRHDDAGAAIDRPITIPRTHGLVNALNGLQIGSTTVLGGPISGYTNRIINGDFRLSQRAASVAGVTTNLTGTPAGYATVDRFLYLGNGTPATVTLSRVADSPTLGANGFSNKVLVTTNKAAVAAGDYAVIEQKIEGYNVADLLQLGANIVVDFWVKSPKTGVHYLGLRNNGISTSYVTSYSVSVINTWERKTLVIPLSGALAVNPGGWDLQANVGLDLVWPLVAGSSSQTATLNSWISANAFAGNSVQNLLDTNANVFQLGDVQVFGVASAGAGAALAVSPPPFERRPLAVELSLCERYYQFGITAGQFIATGAGQFIVTPWQARQFMRAVPTMVASNASFTNASGASFAALAATGGYLQFQSSGAGTSYAQANWTAYAEL